SWPPRSPVVFIEGTKKRIVGDHVDIDAWAAVVPILVLKRRLSGALAGHAILLILQTRMQKGFARHRFEIVVITALLFFRQDAAVMQKSGHHCDGCDQSEPQS